MLRRSSSSRISNRKMLKTEGGDDVASTSSCETSKTRAAPDCVGEEISSGSASPEANPLQNAVILRHLFELCPVDVLETCRLVCKQWYEESLLPWRNSCSLRFTTENGHIVMTYVGNGGVRRTIPLQDFLVYVADPKYQCQKKPYRYIWITYSIIGSNIANKNQFEIFWSALGSKLTTLELEGCEFPDDEEFRKIIFTHCPKLERLIIHRCQFTATRTFSSEELDPLEQHFEQNKQLKELKIVNTRNLPVSWLELFSHFPLISSLTVAGCCGLPSKEFPALTEAIRMIRKKDGKLLPFKFFDVGTNRVTADPLDKQRLAIFQELRLPIRRLFVTLEPGVVVDSLRDTFAFCASTLKDVTLSGWRTTALFSEFQLGNQLDKVLTLSIADHDFSKYLPFMKHMPNLEKLQIFNNLYHVSQLLPVMAISNTDEPEPITHLKMTKLTQLELNCMTEDENISKLHDWMPNITDLSIKLNDQQFGIVCKKWRGLKKLSVCGTELTDEGVTGMKNKTGANITNLQNLEEFCFRSQKLSDKSVFHGFLQLPNLRILTHCEPIRWGKGAREAILDRKIRLVEKRF